MYITCVTCLIVLPHALCLSPCLLGHLYPTCLLDACGTDLVLAGMRPSLSHREPLAYSAAMHTCPTSRNMC